MTAMLVAAPVLAAPGEDDTPIANPDLQRSCGLDIHVILDESSSIGAQLAPDVRSAFRAFTTALKNTGSRMAVSEFSVVADLPLSGSAKRAYTTVTDATIANVFEPYIANGYNPAGANTGGTNWEDGLRMGRYFLPRPGTQPHLVVFITDGDPNRVIRTDRVTYQPGSTDQARNEYELKVPLDGSTETASAASTAAKDAAVPNANGIKAQGSHILTVAVGEAVNNQSSLNRIMDVSGPDVFTGSGTFDIATDDVYRVPNFADLQAALREAAFQLCAPSITVQKLVDDTPDPGSNSDAVPAEGWDISATADPEPDDWVLPPGATGGTATATTDATGFASFQWTTAAATSSNVEISEQQQAGYENDQSATSCTYRTPDQGDTPLPLEVTDGGFSANVPHRAIVTCRLVNRATPQPSIEIEKATNGADADSPPGPFIPFGTPVNWTYVVTNTGNDTLSSIAVADDQGVPLDCPGTSLGPGEKMTCTASGTALGVSYANVGSVTAVDPFGTPVGDSDPSHYTGSIAGIDVEKFTNDVDADDAPGPYVPVGDPVSWTYVVTNTGNTALTGVAVDDDQGVTVTCPATTLAPGASMTCTAPAATSVAGQYENVATASGVNGLGQTARDSDPSHYFGEDASVDVEKATNGEDADAAPGPFISVGGGVIWSYRVTNTGNVALSPWSVTDDHGMPLACPRILSLAPGQRVVCRGGGTATAGQYANVGTVVGGTPSGASVTDSDPSHYFGVQGAIELVKSTNGENADQAPGPFVAVGGPVEWTYRVTNTGNSDLTNVQVADFTLGQVITCPQDALAVGESMTCAATGVATAGQYTNFAAASGDVPTGQTVVDSDPSNYFGAAPGINVKKYTNGVDADDAPGPLIPVGQPVDWTYVVTNTGNEALSDVAVDDDDGGVTVTCPKTTLDPGEEMTCTASGTAALGDYENTGTATGTAAGGGGDVSDSDPSHYFGSVSRIRVKKFTNGADADDAPGPTVAPGSTVTWTYEVTNPGNVAIRDLALVDDKGVLPSFTGGDADDDGELDPGETWRYRGVGIAGSAAYENTATATGLDLLETQLSSTDPSHYSVPPAALVPPPVGPLPPPPAAGSPSLRFSKVADRARVRTGGLVRYRLRVRNVGNAAAHRIRVCDRLPRALQYAADGAARIRGRRACFTLRRLAAHHSRSFRLRTRAVSVERARRVCNVASLSGRGVRSRTGRACVRVLPVASSCPARSAQAIRAPRDRPRARVSC